MKRRTKLPVITPPPSFGVDESGLLYDSANSVVTNGIASGMDRRGFLKATSLASAATIVSASAGSSLLNTAEAKSEVEPFEFAIMADPHTMGPQNPLMKYRLETAIEQINDMYPLPDFVLMLGDVIHDGTPGEFQYFADIMQGLKTKVYYVPGEHDWYLDMGEYYMKHFIAQPNPWYSFDHKGTHFLALHGCVLSDFWTKRNYTPEERMYVAGTIDNPEQGPFKLGRDQLDWIERDLSNVDKDTPLILFSHAPLYQYWEHWNFWIDDAPDLHELLKPFKNVRVFHAHVHQLVEHQINNMHFTGVLSTSWPHPYPPTYHTMGLTKQMPRPNPALPLDGLGWARASVNNTGEIQHKDILWTLRPPKS